MPSIFDPAAVTRILPNGRGVGRITDFRSSWERIRETADIEDVRIHGVRHSFASMGAMLGDSLMVTGALLDHRSATTTERYTHLADHPVEAAVNRIADEIARHLDRALAGGRSGRLDRWRRELRATMPLRCRPALKVVVFHLPK